MSNDVSLDDELLLVTEKKSKVPQKAKADKSSKRDEEGEVSSNGEESDHKSNKRKPKVEPKKPLKKRKTDSSDESSEDEAFDDGWDDDLMGDDADRERLHAMPEIEREAILSERYQKRKELRDGWEVKRRLRAEQRAREKKEGETRNRAVNKPDTKGKALSELKKKRAKAGYRHDDDDEVEEGEVEDEKEDGDDDYDEPKKKKGGDDFDVDSLRKDDEKIVYHDEDDDDEDQGHPVTLEDVEQMRLGREILEKWMDKPFFDSLIPGFFVRIGIGMDPQTRMNVYRLAQVDSVVNKTSYPLNGKQTTKWLKLYIGDKAKEFRMETISNRKFSESEYKHWKLQMERAMRPLPMSKEVQKKLETKAKAQDYRYTSDDIEKMLAEKKKTGALPISVAAEKARLGIERDTTTDPEKKAELEKRLAQLDEMAKEKDKKRVNTKSVFNINQRNKQYNFDTVLKSKVEEKSGNSDLDPFSRRKTMPTIVYASKHKDEAPKPEETPVPAATNGTPSTAPAPTPTPLTSSGSLSSSSSSLNPLKSSAGTPAKTSEHDSIDIDIPDPSSAPSRPHAFLAHPSAPTPTTPPFVQAEKKAKSTLSLDDYMRRRRAME